MTQHKENFVGSVCSLLKSKLALVSLLTMLFSFGAWAIITDLSLVKILHPPEATHLDQQTLNDLEQSGDNGEAFDTAFEHGDQLFETTFNAVDGVGANVGNGQRFTRVPRADLSGPGQWANHFPARETGPNAASCNACHNMPSDDGAGGNADDVHRDPFHTGNLKKMIHRNTPHTFGGGAVQRLGEEMTEQLHAIRSDASTQACAKGSATEDLVADGISFGKIKVTRTSSNPCKVSVSTSNVKGVSADLVIRPFQWKGSVAFIRDFNRGAAHNELGMEATELAGDGVDGDFDGVTNELSVGDITALTVYLAAQPRPTTLLELNSLGLKTLSQSQIDSIQRGSSKFNQIGCASCHVPSLTINNPIFSEPSQDSDYRDAPGGTLTPSETLIPGEQSAPAMSDPLAPAPQTQIPQLDPSLPVTLDLTLDQPDNRILDQNGNVIYRLGSLRKNNSGQALVELYGDLRRHNMGPGDAESIDEVGTGAAVFLTENLWGVGTTAPYMHDGRATTLTEAILEHGGEGANAKNAFVALSHSDQKDLINFLNNLVLFKMED
jgi:hypothetical protein